MKTSLLRIPALLLASLFVVLTGCMKTVILDEDLPDPTYATRAVGASARDLLTDSAYSSLLIELNYMTGHAPDSAALRNLEGFLYQHLHKPGGIRIETREIPAVHDTLSSLTEVAAIEQQYRRRYNHDRELTVYILYTNGVFVKPEMLGYAYFGTSAVLFGRNLSENSNRARRPSRTDLETKVLQHELGHLLGLVNVGSPEQSEHSHEGRGKHCRNKRCLMYYLIDTEASPSFLLRKPLPKLCDACRKDIRVNGGK
ncbi:MAG: hypothetical protein EOO11_13915 [Chitinophagaceae bacterium]|nr:MAG: hypothetical protein EOO11_13915 [Chitinophagaceae bacterium]